MRTGLAHAMAWSLATGAAVTLSWWGVHTVMAGTAYDPPRALPINTDGMTTRHAGPVSSSTQRPRALSPTPDRSPAVTPRRSQRPSVPASPGRTAKHPRAGVAPRASGSVKSYTTDGGRVVLDIADASAQLVSATPDSGWDMRVWKQPTWIRITFTRAGRERSVFCTWYDHGPLVELDGR